MLRQDKITFVLTSPLQAGGPINDHINRHGDGVKAVALWVDDAEELRRNHLARCRECF